MDGKSFGLEICLVDMVKGLVNKRGNGVGENSWDDVFWGLERLGKEEWSLVGVFFVRRSMGGLGISNLSK